MKRIEKAKQQFATANHFSDSNVHNKLNSHKTVFA